MGKHGSVHYNVYIICTNIGTTALIFTHRSDCSLVSIAHYDSSHNDRKELHEEIRDDFLSTIEDPGFTACNDTRMEVPVNQPDLTAAVPSPEWKDF